MATTKKSSSRKASSSKNSRSKAKVSQTKLRNNRFNTKFLFVFLALFAVVGGLVIYYGRAESPGQLLLSKEYVRPLSVSKTSGDTTGNSAKRNYQDLSFQVYVNGDVVCGDPADPNTVTTTSLSSGQLKALQKQIETTGIDSQPDGLALTGEEVIIGDNVTTITYNKDGQEKSIIATADKPQSGVVNKITALGENVCKQATTKINRAQATVPERQKIEKNKSNSANLEKVTSYLKNQMMPKASAEWWGYSKEAEDVQYRYLEAARAYFRLPYLNHGFCEAISARVWSRNLDVHNSLYHTNVGPYRDQWCGATWTGVGENIGVGPCAPTETDTTCSLRLYNAFAASKPHRDNMLSAALDQYGNPIRYDTWGVGAVRDRVSNKMWITHEFTRH